MLAAALGLCVAIGCATPEERYRTLSFFFDDVPLPESMRPGPEPEPAATASEQETEAPRPREPAPEWTIHAPECEECHTSKSTSLTYAEPPALCWDCHDDSDFVDAVPHGPFAAGACLQCHSPHKSQYPSLLRSAPSELCGECHDATTYLSLDAHRTTRGEDCIGCHDPHAGPERYMLHEGASAAAPAPEQGRKTGARS